jgi:hypothetical protein
MYSYMHDNVNMLKINIWAATDRHTKFGSNSTANTTSFLWHPMNYPSHWRHPAEFSITFVVQLMDITAVWLIDIVFSFLQDCGMYCT